jgi:hypothetical protein
MDESAHVTHATSIPVDAPPIRTVIVDEGDGAQIGVYDHAL